MDLESVTVANRFFGPSGASSVEQGGGNIASGNCDHPRCSKAARERRDSEDGDSMEHGQDLDSSPLLLPSSTAKNRDCSGETRTVPESGAFLATFLVFRCTLNSCPSPLPLFFLYFPLPTFSTDHTTPNPQCSTSTWPSWNMKLSSTSRPTRQDHSLLYHASWMFSPTSTRDITKHQWSFVYAVFVLCLPSSVSLTLEDRLHRKSW